MEARVTMAFSGRVDDEPLPRPIGVGEIVRGDLARAAIEMGVAELHEAGAETGAADEGADLSQLKRAALDAIAIEKGIDPAAHKSKAELIAAIEAAGQA